MRRIQAIISWKPFSCKRMLVHAVLRLKRVHMKHASNQWKVIIFAIQKDWF